LIGLEGVMALWVPLVVGAWSDSLCTPLGGRLPFLVAATPLVVATLMLLGLARSTRADRLLQPEPRRRGPTRGSKFRSIQLHEITICAR